MKRGLKHEEEEALFRSVRIVGTRAPMKRGLKLLFDPKVAIRVEGWNASPDEEGTETILLANHSASVLALEREPR